MSDGLHLQVDAREVTRALRKFGKKAENGTKPLGRFDKHWKLDANKAWNAAKVTGGKFWDKMWEGHKPQYTRKDGTVVPSWGGVKKVKRKVWGWAKAGRSGARVGVRRTARGNVKGRKRTGRKNVRVRKTDVLNVDTGLLKRSLLAARPKIIKRVKLVIGGNLPDYSPHVFKLGGRNPLRFVKHRHARMLKKAGDWYFRLLAKDFNRGR